jgi:hypothetical protein
MNLTRCLCAVLLFSLLFASHAARAAYIDEDPSSSCSVRVQYPSSVPANPEVFIMGVGTAMSRSSYDFLSAQITAKGYVIVNMDHQPGSLTKTDATAYTNCAQAVKNNIATWLGPMGYKSAAHWIMGGHSAGGQAAQAALSANPSFADAIFSLDPYNANNAGNVKGPALYWGFSVTTCFVTINDAAKAAYYKTTSQREFIRVKGIYSFNPCGYAPTYFHCSFCDAHCPACTNCTPTPASFYVDVANSVQKFIKAAFYGSWSKANLTSTYTTPTDTFVDSDAP